MNNDFNNIIEKNICNLFEKYCNEKPISINVLPTSGSYRIYFRIKSNSQTLIGVYNEDAKENLAFIKFTNHFISKGLPVPTVLAEYLEKSIYLLNDLGDTTLFSYLSECKNNNKWNDEITSVYRKVLDLLPSFQIDAGKDLDYKYCYPRSSFDKQSMMWDLNYFKYYFLKLAKISFDEQKLENDFETFTNYLLQAESNYFLYREFQSRNIMLKNNIPFFIDYQGGRKGALQYDLASLLYDAKADIPQEIRNELLDYYIDVAKKHTEIKNEEFKSFYYGFVLIRITQALGAYGFRGFYERKEHFLASIPFALNNLDWILNNSSLPIEIPELKKCWDKLVKSAYLRKIGGESNKLKVKVFSFSFKKGFPEDTSGNGGGFVFDCRALPNPGRYDEYKKLTGNDKDVIEFLDKSDEMKFFLKNIFEIVDKSVENYSQRKFSDLMVSFGCTGGQHRSVYSANAMVKHLKEKYDVNVILKHKELT